MFKKITLFCINTTIATLIPPFSVIIEKNNLNVAQHPIPYHHSNQYFIYIILPNHHGNNSSLKKSFLLTYVSVFKKELHVF